MSYTPYIPDNLDAFQRLRVSSPHCLFDAQFTYGLQDLLFERYIDGAGVQITHDTVNRCALLESITSSIGAQVFMQSYEYMRYYPGISSQILITFNMIEIDADTIKYAGYSDGSNGFEFRVNGTAAAGEELELMILSDSAVGDQKVSQPNWNLDKLDGTGKSGITLDVTKTQILAIDFQALYVGRVRFGFVIDGKLIYVHEFLNANLQDNAYIQTANLPIRAGMTCVASSTTSMRLICSSVITENGGNDNIGYGLSFYNNIIASTTRTHLLSIRPKTTFNGFVNRGKVSNIQIELMVTGNNPVIWELCLGQATTGATAYADVNTNYSFLEQSINGTANGSPSIIIDSGFIPATAGTKSSATHNIVSKYPITLDSSGAVRSLGTLSLIATTTTGSSTVYGSIKWLEIR
jgi:hypothetical protein